MTVSRLIDGAEGANLVGQREHEALGALLASPGGGVSVDTSAVDRLRELGCDITQAPRCGGGAVDGRLVRSGLSVWGEHLAWALQRKGGGRWDRRVSVYRTTRSTQDVVRRMSGLGAGGAGVLVVADEQTRGRGRLGRRWVSEPGGAVMFSVSYGGEAERAVKAAAVAIVQAVRSLLRPGGDGAIKELWIKWPNDVLVGDRKLAGVLVETHRVAAEGGGRLAVVGVGLNVLPVRLDPGADGRSEDAPPPICLRELGIPHDRLAVLVDLVATLEGHLRETPEPELEEAWRLGLREQDRGRCGGGATGGARETPGP